jgi:excisionase family DNA binding protein
MEATDLNFEALANRYRRRWERSLKTAIKRAQDKTYAAALYLSLLKSYELIHLNNPFLRDLWLQFQQSEKLGFGWAEFFHSAQKLRESHRFNAKEELERIASEQQSANQEPVSPWADWFTESDATAYIIPPPEAIVVKSELSGYVFFAEIMESDGEGPVKKFVVRMKCLEMMIERISIEYELDDADLLEILDPDKGLFTQIKKKTGSVIRETKEILNEQPEKKEMNGVKEIMNAEEAAAFLHMAMPTLYEKTSKGILPHSKPGGKLLFNRRELEQWVRDGRIHTQQEVEQLANEQWRKLNGKKKH